MVKKNDGFFNFLAKNSRLLCIRLFYFHFFEIKTNKIPPPTDNQNTDMDSQTKVVSSAGKRMLSFALSSAVSHNKKNLAHGAKQKNPSKFTVAEKEALQTFNEKTVKLSVWQKCSDKSDKSWEAYLAKKAHAQRSVKLADVWQHCSDLSDNSWSNYVWSKDNAWKYCSKTKRWNKTLDCA